MPTTPTCPECGTPLPADAPQGLCPKCLLRRGMDVTDVTLTSSELQPTVIANPTPLTAPATIRYFGDYELDHEIARGGMGAVFKARQVKLNRPVAVKMILERLLSNEAMVKRFYTEAEAAANLQHPNIVAIHEIGAHDGQHYFSMDYVEGKNLAQLTGGKPLAPARAARYVQSMAVAIHYAHQRGTLHRDLKPSNVLIDEQDQPRITDFGLAKLTQNGSHLTVDGAVMGTPSYMSPEQAAGRQDQIGPHSDVYSLGAILYELLTGKPPFQAATLMATMRAVIESDPVAPRKLNPDVPLDIETICLKCLEKSPQRRYPSARELSEELGRFLKGEPIFARPASLIRKTASWTRQHPRILAALASLLILGLAVVVFYQWERIAFLIALGTNPDLPRQAGPRLAAAKAWCDMALWVYLIGQLTEIGFGMRQHGIKWTHNWRKTEFYFKYLESPTQSAGPEARAVAAILGLLIVVYAIFVTGIVIQAFVWEGVTPSFWEMALPFASCMLGVNILAVVVRDYRLSIFGMPSHELTADQNEAIGRTVVEGDIPGAMRIYRQALPDANLIDASEHVSRLEAELGIRPVFHPVRTLNWQRMAICAGIETLLVGGIVVGRWLDGNPWPFLSVLCIGAGLCFGMLIPAFLRFTEVWQRTLGMVIVVVVFIFPWSEAKFRPPFIMGIICGIILMMEGLKPRGRAELTSEHHEAIRSAILGFDILGAIRIYRQAVPDASLSEARGHVLSAKQNLGAQQPSLSFRTLNWQRMAIKLGIAAPIVASLWMLFPQLRPVVLGAAYCYGSILPFTLWNDYLPRIKGRWERRFAKALAVALVFVWGWFAPPGPSYIGTGLLFSMGMYVVLGVIESLVSGLLPKRRE